MRVLIILRNTSIINCMKYFSKIYKEDLDNVGKKAVELAELSRLGVPIPNGFVLTTSFFKKFLDQTGISEKIKEVQELDHPAISESLGKLFDPIRKQIMQTHIPENLTLELHRFYKKLAGLFKESSLNIFSSSPSNNKSLIFKNIRGDTNLILKIKEIWADNINKPVAIVIQKNIVSKTKGIIITNNPPKDFELIAKKIHKHFYFPQVADYVIEKNKIYITEIKPFTGVIEYKSTKTKSTVLKSKKTLIKGVPINPGIVTGPVKILSNSHLQIKNGEIVVLPQLNKSFFPKIRKAKAIVVDAILLNSYEQMVYRKDIKIPTITGAVNATKVLQNGSVVTVNGISGEIYSGGLIY